MSSESSSVSRRSVLKRTAGVATAGAGAGLASATQGGGPPDGNGHRKYNVGFDAEAGRAAAREAASGVVREFSFDALTVRLPEQAVEGLRNRPDVRYVEEETTLSLGGGTSSAGGDGVTGEDVEDEATVTPQSQTLPSGVDRIDADEIRGIEDGSGVDVAILSSGIDSDHPDLAPNLGLGVAIDDSCSSCDAVWGDYGTLGTGVAGVVGAVDDADGVVGVAPGVTLHAVQVCDSGFCEAGEVAAGLEWTADQGYGVANMSFGGSHTNVVSDAVAYAADRDVVMVALAGDSGPCTDCVDHPANENQVIAVSATNPNDELKLNSAQGPEIELCAPGGDTETTEDGGGTFFLSGTAAAAAHVTGAAALARTVYGSREEVEDRLLEKSEDLGLPPDEQGLGMVDAEAIFEKPLVVGDGFTLGVDGTATIMGDLKELGRASSADVYFEWGLSGGSLSNTTAKQSTSSTGTFSDAIPTTCGTSYVFRAVVEASDGGFDRSATQLFTTLPCNDCNTATEKICPKGESDDD